MTKLEWCRTNAPEALKNESDDFILEHMSSAYDRFIKDESCECKLPLIAIDSSERSGRLKYLDIMTMSVLRLFGNDVAFKGGYMLNKLLPNESRFTKDVDFSIQNSELYSSMIKLMTKLGDNFVSKGYIDHYTIKPEIHERQSGGMSMYDKKGGCVLGIDVGWHDLTFGTTTFDLNGKAITAFSTERMLSDKICVIASRKRFRRTKDLYDLYVITNNFDVNMEGLSLCINKRDPDLIAKCHAVFPTDILEQYSYSYNVLDVSDADGKPLLKPGFSDVLSRYYLFINELKSNSSRSWKHVGRVFE